MAGVNAARNLLFQWSILLKRFHELAELASLWNGSSVSGAFMQKSILFRRATVHGLEAFSADADVRFTCQGQFFPILWTLGILTI